MAALILAIVAGLIGALPQILTLIETRTTARKEKRDALAALELKDTQDAMAVADRELERLSPPAKQPILLSPDDHL